MRKSYIAKLAIKNITGHKLRSVLTILGITIGVGFIVFLVSLGFGLQRISTQEISNLEALQIIDATPGKSKIVKLNEEAIEKFRGISNVEMVETQTELVGNFTLGSSSVEGIVYGKNLEYLELEDISLESGRQYTSNMERAVLINKTAARQLGFNDSEKILNNNIDISFKISPELLDDNEEKQVIVEEVLPVVGVLSNEESPYVYIPLTIMLEKGLKNYGSAKIKVDNKEKTETVKQQVENLGYKVTALKDTVDQINQFFSIFQLILLAFGSIAILIAALGMFNTLTISLLEKTREISFMKILGTTSGDIWKLFIAEALIIGIMGGALGIISGISLGSVLNGVIAGMAQATGNKNVQIFYSPAIFLVITFVATLLVSFLTGVYPSRRASRIDPLEAMRYE